MPCSVDLETPADYRDAHAQGRGVGGGGAGDGAAVATEVAEPMAGEEDARVSKSQPTFVVVMVAMIGAVIVSATMILMAMVMLMQMLVLLPMRMLLLCCASCFPSP